MIDEMPSREAEAMNSIKLFESKHIRSVWDDRTQRWLFAVVDVAAALTESQNPQVYWWVLKKRLLAEGNESVTACNALKLTAADGKQRLHALTDSFESHAQQTDHGVKFPAIKRRTIFLTSGKWSASAQTVSAKSNSTR